VPRAVRPKRSERERCAVTGKVRHSSLLKAALMRAHVGDAIQGLTAYRCEHCGDIHLGRPSNASQVDLLGAPHRGSYRETP
jgi:hypothetical protein